MVFRGVFYVFMKKIAFIYLGRKGAGPVFAYEMAKGFIANGVELYVFISKGIDNFSKWQELGAQKIEALDTYSNKFNFVINTIKFRFSTYRKLKKKYSSLVVDACYLSMAFEHPWDRYILNVLHNPQQIATIHDPIAHSSNSADLKLMKIAKSLLNFGIRAKKPDDVIVLSSCFVDCINRAFNIDKKHIHVIPHGVFDYYNDNTNNEKHNYDKNKINYLFFGRIDKYKGLDVLGKAYSIVKKSNPNTTLTIAGSGDFSPYVKIYSELPDVSIINRWIKDEEIKSFFDPESNVILVLPYIDATQSGVIPIAMFNKIPVIVSNAGGLVEQVKNNITGFVTNIRDENGLADIMQVVGLNDNRKIVDNAYKYISELSWDVLSKKVLDIVK